MNNSTIKATVSTRRWFQKSFGNTYHTVAIQFKDENGKVLFEKNSDITYGYGEHYKQTANEIINKQFSGGIGEVVFAEPLDVKRKKDLKDWN